MAVMVIQRAEGKQGTSFVVEFVGCGEGDSNDQMCRDEDGEDDEGQGGEGNRPRRHYRSRHRHLVATEHCHRQMEPHENADQIAVEDIAVEGTNV